MIWHIPEFFKATVSSNCSYTVLFYCEKKKVAIERNILPTWKLALQNVYKSPVIPIIVTKTYTIGAGNITYNTVPLKEGFWKIPMLCRSRTETLGIPSSGLLPNALAQQWKPKWAQQVLQATSHATADFLQQSGMHSRWAKFHDGDLNVNKIE